MSTPMIIPEIDEIVNFYTPELIEEIARETGFVQRESKLGGVEFLGVMTQGLYSHPDATLNQMAGMIRDINPEVEISAPGLHQRINQSGVAFLEHMLSRALELSACGLVDESIPKLLVGFKKVHILDSTQISLPEKLLCIWKGSGGDASEAGMKFQLMLDHKSGKYESIVITDGIKSDRGYIDEAVKQLGAGDLLIDDLGYSKQEAMMDISARGAYFLSRFNHRTGLYQQTEDGSLGKFDLVKELKKALAKGIESCEFGVWLSKNGRSLKIRFIAERVPDDVADERRRKARKTARKKGRSPTKKHMFLLGWSLYITTVAWEILKTESVSLLYRLRWQIELVFKVWKSYHGLAQVRGERPERIECFIYGRLIMIVIMAFLFSSTRRYLWNTRKREASLLKVARHFLVKAGKALSLLNDSVALARFLLAEFFEACRLCKMDLRKRLSTAQKLRMVTSYLHA